MTINPTAERVRLNTSEVVNEQVRHETEKRVAFYAAHPELIDRRLS